MFRDKVESDERIIEQLIVGNKYKKIRHERLLGKGEDLSLDVAIDIARPYTYRNKNSLMPSLRKKTTELEETNNYDYKLTPCL